MVYFSGNREVATEKHLYAASFLPNKDCGGGLVPTIHQVTSEPGFHSCTVAASAGYLVDVFSSVHQPVVTRLYALNTAEHSLTLVSELCNNATFGRLAQQSNLLRSMVPPSLLTINSTDGQVELHMAVYLPPGVSLNSQVNLPAIVSVYGGPHVQYVRNQWLLTADLRSQRMAQQGFVVIKCDNRGSSRRGLAFEGAMHRDMGNVEVQDQVAAVEYLASKGLVDIKRVGMFGWSYGGYMSAMSLCRAPHVFSCAVAGAPVTSWDGYDTHYTGRKAVNC